MRHAHDDGKYFTEFEEVLFCAFRKVLNASCNGKELESNSKVAAVKKQLKTRVQEPTFLKSDKIGSCILGLFIGNLK